MAYTDAEIIEFIEQQFQKNIPVSLREIARHFQTSHAQIKRILLRNNYYDYYLRRKEEIKLNTEKDISSLEKEVQEDSKIAYYKQQISFWKKKYNHLLKISSLELQLIEDFRKSVQKYKPVSIEYTRNSNSKQHKEEPILLLSDLHIGEEVLISDVIDKKGECYLNRYDIDIFAERMQKLYNGLLSVIERLEKDKKYDRLNIFMLGDMVSGVIHEELLENSLNISDQVIVGAEIIADFIYNLLKKFPKIEVYGVIGNHSVIEDTEILTRKGWKKAKDITYFDEVAMFDMKTGEITFDVPLMISSRKVDKIVKVKTEQGYEEVSEWHALIVNGERRPVLECMRNGLNQRDMRFTGYLSDKERKPVKLSDNWIRLITWLVIDGTWVSSSKRKKRLQWKLSKPRKIQALTKLLDEMNIPYTIQPATKSKKNKLQPYLIRVYGHYARLMFRYLKGKKQFPEWFKYLNRHQLEVLLETLAITDGRYIENKIISWSSTNLHNINVVQSACIFNGIYCKYSLQGRRKKDDNTLKKVKDLYEVFINLNDSIQSGWAMFEVERGEYRIVSITTKKDTLITRLNGKVNFTGNSRIKKKPYFKHKWDGFDYLLYKYIEAKFENIRNVNFVIPKSPMIIVNKFNKWNFLLRHGDGKSQSFAGIPVYGIMRTSAKATQLFAGKQDIYIHYEVMGHYHTPMSLPKPVGRIFVNGTLKGTDEFSFNQFLATDVSQKLLICNEAYGVYADIDIYCGEEL